MRKAERSIFYFLLTALLMLGNCSLDYEEAGVAEDIAEETPETVFIDFTHSIVDSGRLWVVLEAERAESYPKRKEIILDKVRFREYDEQGELVIEGLAGEAVFFTDSENAALSGSIFIYSALDEAGLYADRLTWTREGKVLESGGEAPVLLRKDDGSYMEGSEFRADLRRKEFSFNSGVTGRYEQPKE
jgi:LPS export ABC transporter protein LptC